MTSPVEPTSSLQSLHLDLPPSCLEFCPAHLSFFLVGTYNLQKHEEDSASAAESAGSESDKDDAQTASSAKAQNRNGSIIAFQVSNDKIVHVQTEPQPSALLDLHFNPNAGHHDICAVVSSTATLALFKLSPGQDQPLKHLKTMDMASMSAAEDPNTVTDVLFLSFCWHPSRADMIALTTSTGGVLLVDLGAADNSWKLFSEPIITHTLEAWCVAISPSLDLSVQSRAGQQDIEQNAFTLFSGGDDSTLRYQTISLIPASDPSQGRYALDETSSQPAANRRGHEAGVTAILPLCLTKAGSGLIVTGSYDDHIRLFSVAPYEPYVTGKAEMLAESNLGGGVWRLKRIDLDNAALEGTTWRVRILASCMHAGARIVELEKTASGEHLFHTIARFEEHESMNYGSDFLPGRPASKLTVVSTSFYDKLLCLWKPELV
ncbi:hypothetical protein B0T22DRAFT_379086 [Podospora appendiculata]|uniref:Diphthamide biosynthesis protein 7 n=1 Tax=Podospora appendiculata TaxID=314037 RepID=A0AAE0XCP5_9PEZI|nr:hypothetical protein B0T22DRAFT_379086 [Podospora appendiculata]